MISKFVRKVANLQTLTTGEATTADQDEDRPDLLAQKVKRWYKKFVDQQLWDPLEKTPNDWRWQRVFGQFAVLILLGTFLCIVDSDTDTALENFAGILLAAVVAAGIWSGGVSAVLLVHSVCHIVRRIHNRTSPNNQQAKKPMRGFGRIKQFIPKLFGNMKQSFPAMKQRIAEFFLSFGGRSGTPARTGDLSNRRSQKVSSGPSQTGGRQVQTPG